MFQNAKTIQIVTSFCYQYPLAISSSRCLQLSAFQIGDDYLLTGKMQHYRDGWRSTNDLVNHTKDIHEIKDNQPLSFNHVHCRGVAARAGSVHTQWTGSWARRERPEHAHNTILKEAHSPRNFDRPPTGSPQTMPIVQHSPDIDDIPPPQPHNPLPAWVEQPFTH